jgi:hypothetical protein
LRHFLTHRIFNELIIRDAETKQTYQFYVQENKLPKPLHTYQEYQASEIVRTNAKHAHLDRISAPSSVIAQNKFFDLIMSSPIDLRMMPLSTELGVFHWSKVNPLYAANLPWFAGQTKSKESKAQEIYYPESMSKENKPKSKLRSLLPDIHPVKFDDISAPSFARLIIDSHEKLSQMGEIERREEGNEKKFWQILSHSSPHLFHPDSDHSEEPLRWNPPIPSSKNIPIISDHDRLLLLPLESLQEWFDKERMAILSKYFRVTSHKLQPPPGYTGPLKTPAEVLRKLVEILESNPGLWPEIQRKIKALDWKEINLWALLKLALDVKESQDRSVSVVIAKDESSLDRKQKTLEQSESGVTFQTPVRFELDTLKLSREESEKVQKHVTDILDLEKEKETIPIIDLYDRVWTKHIMFSMEFPIRLRIFLRQMSESSSMLTKLPYERLRVILKLNKRLQDVYQEEAAAFVKHEGPMSWMY